MKDNTSVAPPPISKHVWNVRGSPLKIDLLNLLKQFAVKKADEIFADWMKWE